MFTRHLITSAGILAISGVISRFLGVVRDQILATNIGPGDILDAYYIALKIPDTLYLLLVTAPLSAALIPLMNKEKDTYNPLDFLSGAATITLCIISITSIILGIFAPTIIPLISPLSSPETHEISISLVRYLLLSPILFLFLFFSHTYQNTKNIYLFQGITPIIYNIGIIFGALVLYPLYSIHGVVYGLLGGLISMNILSWIASAYYGYIPYAHLLNTQQIRQLFTEGGARVVTLFMQNLQPFAEIIIATSLGSGSLFLVSLAFNIQSVPLGIIAISLSVPAFVSMSQANTQQTRKNISEETLKITFALIVPSTIALYHSLSFIIPLVFEYKSFDATHSQTLIHITKYYLLFLPVSSLIPHLSRTLFSEHRTRESIGIQALSSSIGILSIFTLPQSLESIPIALGVSACVQVILLLIYIKPSYSTIRHMGLVALINTLLLFFPFGKGLQIFSYCCANYALLRYKERI